MKQHIQHRRDPAATWLAINPVLKAGEIGIESDSLRFKIGDGTSVWTSLGYGGSTRLSDLTDVNQSQKVDGSVLIYNATAGKFVADAVETKITLTDGGNF
jgi:hypothetical protein|tara:strand:+ start:77 stop:376 length:300 start_codon:yes stop_codon:yes gene_type:complete